MGVAADSEGNIYIGELSKITVLSEDGEHLRDIRVNSGNGYSFTVYDDKVFVRTGRIFHVFDLYGNEIDTPVNEDIKNKLWVVDSRPFVSEDGTEYYILNDHVYRSKDGETEMIY